MTLDEAISHAADVAKLHEEMLLLENIKGDKNLIFHCKNCAAEHRQLEGWLEELKEYRGKEQKDG